MDKLVNKSFGADFMKSLILSSIPALLLLAGLLSVPTALPTGKPASELILYNLRTFDALGSGVWSMNPDGTARRKLTQDGYAATISPDGSRIVFHSEIAHKDAFSARGVVPDLYIIDADGGNRRPLTKSEYTHAYSDASWSKDNHTIVFQITNQNGVVTNSSLATINSHNMQTTVLNDIKASESDYEPSFSPVGDQIVFASGPRYTEMGQKRSLYVTDSSGFFSRRLTWQGNGNNGSRDDANPAFSPDGQHIVFCRTEVTAEIKSSVYSLNSDGRNLKKLCEQAEHPRFTPDGKRIAFLQTKRVWKTDKKGKNLYYFFTSQLWTMNLDGSNQRPLPNVPKDIIAFDWR